MVKLSWVCHQVELGIMEDSEVYRYLQGPVTVSQGT